MNKKLEKFILIKKKTNEKILNGNKVYSDGMNTLA